MKPEKSLAMLLSQEISATLKKYSPIIIQWRNKDSWECFFSQEVRTTLVKNYFQT